LVKWKSPRTEVDLKAKNKKVIGRTSLNSILNLRP